MGVFEVATPGGQKYQITAPDQATAMDAFARMQGGQQNNPPAVGDRAAELAKATTPPTDSAGGLASNAIAGIDDLFYRTLGAPVDAANTALRGGAAALHAAGGPDIQLPVDTVGGHQSIADAFNKVGVTDPAKIVPQTEAERLARAGGEGIGMAVAPEAALASLAKLGIVGPAATELAGMIVGKAETVPAMAANAAIQGTAAVAGQGASDAAPAPLKPLAAVVGGMAGGTAAAGALAVPRMVGAGAQIAKDFVAPLSQGGREQMAGKTLVDAATNPNEAIDTIGNAGAPLVPGSNPTTGQQTGDMGLLALERGVAAKDPAAFNQRRADQNAARVSTVENLQPTGAPEQVAASVTQHLDNIDKQATAAADAATSAAQQRTAAVGQGQAPEVAGGAMRSAYEDARSAAKTQERALWNAVDPNGTLALEPAATRDQVATTLQDMPKSAKPPEGEEARIYQVVDQYDGVVPLKELAALQSDLKTAMRQERLVNGESPAYRRMTQLNGAVQNDLETAVAGKVAEQQQQVAAGKLSQEQTIEAAIRRQQEAWLAERSASAQSGGGGASAFRNGPTGPAPVPGVRGATGETGVGPGGAPGNPGLSANDLVPNFDQTALQRLNSARAATKSRVDTFDNKTLAPIRQRPGTTSPYNMSPAAVPAKIFFPGQKSADAIQAYRAAVGDAEALPLIEQYAIDRLRKAALREDGTLDPSKLAAWRRSHADALRSFPALDARLADAGKASETMAEVAATNKAAQSEVQRSALGKFLGLSDPHDVTNAVGSIFSRQDAVRQMSRLRSAIGNDAQAVAGLRKAVVDFMIDRFIGNTEAATSGIGTMKADQFQSFIAKNKPALHAAGFTDAELSTMDNLAQDLQQANRSIAAVKLPGGSNTAQDVLAARVGDTPASMLTKIVLATAASGGGAGFFAGPIVGTVAAIGTGLLGILRQQGLTKVDELIKDAMLDPTLARMLMMKVKPQQARAAAITIGQRLRRSAVTGLAVGTMH